MLAHSRRGLGKVGWVALVVGGVAVLLFAGAIAAVQVSPVWADGAMPWFVVPGVALTALSVALICWTILRSRLVPKWVPMALIASAALMLAANEQTARILLAVPFGVCWIGVGVMLWLNPARGRGFVEQIVSPR